MSPQSLNRDLGLMLKQRLRERSLSLRQFSELAGVDAATVSRIINGKRKATTEHMTRFADCLGIPVSDLFEAAGYPVRGESSDLHTAIDQIQDVLESSDSCPTRLSIDQIRQQLAHYEQYSHTVEGKETIASRFQKKLQKVSGAGPFIDQLKEMLQIFRYNKCTLKEQALIGSALLYFIATIDVIPDYLFPIGYLDDAVAVNLVVQSLKKSF